MDERPDIDKLKIEIFDIQREQGKHQLEINRLQELRIQKLKELDELESKEK